MASVQDLFDAIERRECVLFLGAGIHYPPPGNSACKYPQEQRPSLGSAFSRELADECTAAVEEEARLDVPDLIGFNEQEKARRELERTIREEQREKKRRFLLENRDNLQRTSWYYEVHRSREKLVDRITDAVDSGK